MKKEHINNLLRLGRHCNEKCLFCNVTAENTPGPSKIPLAEVKLQIRKFAKQPNIELSLSGGEPTIWKDDLLQVIAYAKEVGIKRVQIQTNATLITRDYAKSLKEAGLDNAFVALHSHDKKINDKLTGLKNSYEMVLAGIENLSAERIDVTINTVINKLNYKQFPSFVAFFHDKFPKQQLISLAIVQPFGMAEKNIYLMPKYSEIRPYIAKGLLVAKKNNIKIDNHYCGLPFCFLNNSDLSASIEYNENRFLRFQKLDFVPHDKVQSIFHKKVQARNCFNCYLKNFCNGVWEAYVDYYGPEDLVPDKQSLKWWS